MKHVRREKVCLMPDNNTILTRFFTQRTIKALISSDEDSSVFCKVVRRYNMPHSNNTSNGEMISEIYQYIAGSYRNEYLYKNTLLNKLLINSHRINTTVALTEVPIANSKADFIMINGKAVVYEIKTELDTFDRLENQISDYFKAFDHESKKQKFKSASYDRIINDEASELPVEVLKFQYRSLRNTSKIPISLIHLSNPSSTNKEANQYLIDKFVDGDLPYLPMDWRDNPYIDKVAYENTLNELDYIDQQYQKYGNWHYRPTIGDLISREDITRQVLSFNISPQDIRFSLIGIDLAGKGKDKFAVCRYDLLNNGLEVLNDFAQTESSIVEDMLINFVSKHNPNKYAPLTSLIVIEQEGGGSPLYAQRYFQELLAEFNIPVVLKTPRGSKYQRARPLMRLIKNSKVKVNKDCNYLEDFIDESISLNPNGDGRSPNLVDSASLVHNYLHNDVLGTGSSISIGGHIG